MTPADWVAEAHRRASEPLAPPRRAPGPSRNVPDPEDYGHPLSDVRAAP